MYSPLLKMKQEASGWPEWCQSENDNWRYIRDYHEKEGILLDYNNIKKNPGLRTLAKLMLNSFWGKFGQRSNMPQIRTVPFHRNATLRRCAELHILSPMLSSIRP
jgi:hypothetical protein